MSKPLFPINSPSSVNSASPVKIVKSSGALFSGAAIRERISVQDSDLSPLTKDPLVLQKAKQIILTTNLDNLNHDTVLDWGADVQKEYSDFLNQMLGIFNDDALNETRKLYNSVIDLLNDLQPSEIFKKSIWSRKTPKERFDEKYPVLKNSIENLNKSLDKLKPAKEFVSSIPQKIKELEEKLQPYIVAANFLANYKKQNFSLDLFVSRLTSLMTTEASLQNDKQTYTKLSDMILNITNAVKTTILTETPLFISYFIRLLSENSPDIQQLQIKYTNICSTLTKQ